MLETASLIRCPKCAVDLKAVWSDKGVVIDHCPKCEGVWMDGGEIFHFSKDATRLHWALEQGLRSPHPTAHKCPRCAVSLTEGGLLSDTLLLDQCPACNGIWFDKNELDQLNALEVSGHRPATGRTRPIAAPPPPLRPAAAPPSAGTAVAAGVARATGAPYLYMVSAGVLALLYGMLFLALAIASEAGAFPIWVALVITVVFAGIQFAISPFIMDFMLQWTMSLRWVTPEELPAHLKTFVDRIAKENSIPFPRFGVIDDGTPNAFSYGHMPSNARIVVTRGLMEILAPDEVEAVVAHEAGHALHWDMLVMTVAAIVPMMLYTIYRVAIRMRGGKNNPGPLIAAVAFILYFISEYILLWLSRTREYYADSYAGEATAKPSALASALAKIAFGLAGDQARRELEMAEAKGDKKRLDALKAQDPKRLDIVKALGIFDPQSARAMVASSAVGGAIDPNKPGVDPERLKDAMQWDLWNPWATWYELHSTHPLAAKRIERLSEQSEAMGQPTYVRFDRQKPESYWDDFLIDLGVLMLPWVLGLVGLGLGALTHSPGGVFGLGLMGFGLGSLLETLYRYRGGLFPRSSIAGLLKNVKVSSVRPVPATLKGKIIGRGIPGLIWSEDIVLQDSTGYIFCDYRQPLGIIEFFIGLFRTSGIIGKELTATGWYRRCPVPYFELKTIAYTGDGGEARTSTCYVYITKLIFEGLMILGGLALLIFLR